jgi:hypothetical protein
MDALAIAKTNADFLDDLDVLIKMLLSWKDWGWLIKMPVTWIAWGRGIKMRYL